MKKIIFDGLVIDPYNGDYSCSRGCLQCDKSKRVDPPKYIDIKFLLLIFNYFKSNNIYYNTISFNVFGDFFNNFKFFIKAIYIYEKIGLLNKGNNILLYGEDIFDIDISTLKKFFNLFSGKYNFVLGVNFNLGKSFSGNISLLKYLNEFSKKIISNNLEIRLIINRSKLNNYDENQKKEVIRLLHKISIGKFFSEEEPSGIVSNISLDSLFGNVIYDNCLYTKYSKPKIDSEYLYLPMLNVSKQKISIHGPSCMKVELINFGKIGDNFDIIKLNSLNIFSKLNILENNYKKSSLNGICDFCINNFGKNV